MSTLITFIDWYLRIVGGIVTLLGLIALGLACFIHYYIEPRQNNRFAEDSRDDNDPSTH